MALLKFREKIKGDYVIAPRHDLVIYNIVVRDGFIPVILITTVAIGLSVLILRLLIGIYVFSLSHFVFLFFVVSLYYFYRVVGDKINFRVIIALIMIIALYMAVTIRGAKINEYAIVLIYPIVVYNLTGITFGFIWNIIFAFFYISLCILVKYQLIHSVYSFGELATVFILYVFTAIFAHYAELRHSNIEKLLMRQLYYDSASGQPNRKMLLEDLSHKVYPLLFILKIDNFHDIVTFFGYDSGNRLLAFIGQRLNSFCTYHKLKSYHLSGGEFALLMECGSSEINFSLIKDIAVDLLNHLACKNFSYKEITIPLNVYVGISFYSDEDSNVLSQANMALHHAVAKNHPFHIYSKRDSDKKSYLSNIQKVNELRSAIADDRIMPYFQPVINNKTGKEEIFESLLRIKMIEGEVCLPGEYLDIAYKTRLYNDITKIMFKKIFENAASGDKIFSINISARDIYSYGFMDFIDSMMNDFPSCYNRIILELVESENFENYNLVSDFIKFGKKCGYRFAIDDFGSGYSNFSHLSSLNIDYLKFDGSLIRKIDYDITSNSIVKNITWLCKELGIKTIAEFVETESIFIAVKDFGIDYSQGMFISQAIPQISCSSARV